MRHQLLRNHIALKFKMMTKLKVQRVEQNVGPAAINIASSENPRFIPLEEVARHDTMTDCWIILFDKVYDVTNFIWQHPGGETIILEHAGQDATRAFHDAGHSEILTTNLQSNLIGVLPPEERL